MCASSQRISFPLCQICSVFFRLIGSLRKRNYNIPAGLAHPVWFCVLRGAAVRGLARRVAQRGFFERTVILAGVGAQLAVSALPNAEQQEGNHGRGGPEFG